MTYPIVIPLSSCGGKFKDDTELRFALRSLAKHFKDPFKVAIVGEKLPSWLCGVRHIKSHGGLKSALRDATEAYPDGFFWWYDDLTLLKDIFGEEAKVTPAMNRWINADTPWTRSLEKIRERLVAEGRPAFDYSRPHGPYWFDKEMVDEGFADWPDMKAKFPWESWILSKRNWPRRFGVVKQYYGPFDKPPTEKSIFLNYNDAGNTPELNEFLNARFNKASRFEINKTKQKPKPVENLIVADCTQNTHGLGNRMTILCSAYAAAKATGRELIVAWKPGADCQVVWGDLFSSMADVDFVNALPPYGIRHIACCHTGGRHGHRQIATAGDAYNTPEYWQAWRECARKIQLVEELEKDLPSGHHAIHIRSLYPGREVDCSSMDWCNPFENSYLACDGAVVFEKALKRWPHLKYLNKPSSLSDRGDGRKRDEVRKSAQDMMMMTRAKSILACGGPSTFRNLAHIGYDVPTLRIYKGGSP